jgi:hypothetical protein
MSFTSLVLLLGRAGAGGAALSSGTAATTFYGARNSNYGNSVAISEDGETIAIGAYTEPQGYNYGRIYIYTRSGDTWSNTATITPDQSINARSGNSLSLSGNGNTLVIGKYFENNDTGKALIWTRSGSSWSEATTIEASNKGSGDQFGSTVAINKDGDTIAVSAPYEDTTDTNSGAVYIFTGSGSSWSQQAIIKSHPPIIGGDRLGGYYNGFDRALELSGDGDTLVVKEENGTSGSGYENVYIYTRSGSSWSHQATLNGSDQVSGDQFGTCVSISADGNTVAAGAPNENSANGAVYVFTRSGSSWSQQTKISGANSTERFGRHVGLTEDGNGLVIGADGYNNNDGRIYLYKRSGTTWAEEWNANVGGGVQFGDDPQFGYYCEISDDGAVVLGTGYSYDVDYPGQNAGIARIYI